MTILCATDRLPKSEAAIERACILADQLSADITLLHVVLPRTAAPALEETLLIAHAKMKARARPPLWRASRMPSIAVRTGNAARLILETMRLSDARLLVLGPHRQRLRRDTLEGTIAEKALAARHCPVLIVQNGARLPSASALRAAELLLHSGGRIQTSDPPAVRTLALEYRKVHGCRHLGTPGFAWSHSDGVLQRRRSNP